MKRYQVDLAGDPKLRWLEVINDNRPALYDALAVAEKDIEELIGKGFFSKMALGFFSRLTQVGLVMYAKELEGIAEALGVDLGKVTMLQLMYEFSTCCTSVLKRYKDPKTGEDKVYHFRSMDWDLKDLKPLSIEIEYQFNGNPLFMATSWVGYVGVLTGMRYDAYSVSINYRFLNEGIFRNLINGVFSYWPISFLVRHILTNLATYEEAKQAFRTSYLMAPSYVTLSSKKSGRIFTRDRTRNVRELKLDDFLVQTNIDHWRGESKTDDWQDIENSRVRKAYAQKRLDEPEFNLNLDVDSFWEMFNEYPINKENTLYITGMCVKDNYYEDRFPREATSNHKDFRNVYPNS